MEPFVKLKSYLVPIDRTDVDTDAILPKQYMALTSRVGFGNYLFDNWRYADVGMPGDGITKRTTRPDFPLNQPRYQGAQIMLSRANFGCGSSREHAVWALADWGIKAIIAPSYGDIFYGNCFKNGILPIRSAEEYVEKLFKDIAHIDGPSRWRSTLRSSGWFARVEKLTRLSSMPPTSVLCSRGWMKSSKSW